MYSLIGLKRILFASIFSTALNAPPGISFWAQIAPFSPVARDRAPGGTARDGPRKRCGDLDEEGPGKREREREIYICIRTYIHIYIYIYA